MNRLTSFAVLTLLFLISMLPAKTAAQIKKDSIDAICKQIIDPNGPAVAVLIMKDGKVAYKKTFGYENIEMKIKATNRTQFNIASVSKSFTAAAILQLAERGKLSITDTISKYLKGYANGGKINIHHLLSHTSGLSDTSGNHKQQEYYGLNHITFAEAQKKKDFDMVAYLYLSYVLNGYLQKYPPRADSTMNDYLLFTPGTKYSYSNGGYGMLAKIISNVAGIPFKDYMRKNIFLPLGMKNTFSYNAFNDADIPHPANTYMQMKDSSYRKMFERVPDGEGATNIYTTINDWINYEHFLSGRYPSVLSKRSLEKIFTKHITYVNNAKRSGSYGYGWVLINTYLPKDTLHSIQHSGGTIGTTAYRVLYTDQKISVTIFYAQMDERLAVHKNFDLDNAISAYLKRNKMLPHL